MYYTKTFHALFILTFILNANRIFAQNTFLDSTFNNTGKVVLPLGSSHDIIRGIDIQNDGKIVAAGYSSNGNDYDFTVGRFNITGSLDLNFGNLGISTTAIGNLDDNCLAAKIQPDGKILLGGSSENGNVVEIALVRYNSSGVLDNTFGNNGKVVTQIGDVSYCTSLVLQSDGKIVLGGYSGNNGITADFTIVRYFNNGTIDSSFGLNGIVITDFNNDLDLGHSLTLQPDGKLLLSGVAGNGLDYDCALARYNTDGSLDLNFGIAGRKVTAVGNNNDYANSLALQNDGKILVAGATSNGIDYDFLILRHNIDGTLDSTFGTNGFVVLPIGN